MKTLFIECNMGAAGDMLMGALFEAPSLLRNAASGARRWTSLSWGRRRKALEAPIMRRKKAMGIAASMDRNPMVPMDMPCTTIRSMYPIRKC